VHNSCFFEGARTLACGTLVANPPYIPAPDDDILMPALHGGSDGANLTRVRTVLRTIFLAQGTYLNSLLGAMTLSFCCATEVRSREWVWISGSAVGTFVSLHAMHNKGRQSRHLLVSSSPFAEPWRGLLSESNF